MKSIIMILLPNGNNTVSTITKHTFIKVVEIAVDRPLTP